MNNEQITCKSGYVNDGFDKDNKFGLLFGVSQLTHLLGLSGLCASGTLLLHALHPLLEVLHGHLQLGATDNGGGRVLHGGRVVVGRRGRVAVRGLVADGAGTQGGIPDLRFYTPSFTFAV